MIRDVKVQELGGSEVQRCRNWGEVRRLRIWGDLRFEGAGNGTDPRC